MLTKAKLFDYELWNCVETLDRTRMTIKLFKHQAQKSNKLSY